MDCDQKEGYQGVARACVVLVTTRCSYPFLLFECTNILSSDIRLNCTDSGKR